METIQVRIVCYTDDAILLPIMWMNIFRRCSSDSDDDDDDLDLLIETFRYFSRETSAMVDAYFITANCIDIFNSGHSGANSFCTNGFAILKFYRLEYQRVCRLGSNHSVQI